MTISRQLAFTIESYCTLQYTLETLYYKSKTFRLGATPKITFKRFRRPPSPLTHVVAPGDQGQLPKLDSFSSTPAE